MFTERVVTSRPERRRFISGAPDEPHAFVPTNFRRVPFQNGSWAMNRILPKLAYLGTPDPRAVNVLVREEPEEDEEEEDDDEEEDDQADDDGGSDGYSE